MSAGTFLLLLGFLLAASFLFSGMETGVLCLNRLRIRQLRRDGNRRAEILHGWLEQPERFLWGILVGNTTANFSIVVLLVYFLNDRLTGHPWLISLAFFTVVFLLLYGFCDLLPKTIFRLFPTRLCLAMAEPFRLVNALLEPVVAVMNWAARHLLRSASRRAFTGRLFGTRDELRQFMQHTSLTLTSEERQMVNRVLDLQNLGLRQIAVPLEQSVTVEAGTPLGEVLEICRQKSVTRLPVWRAEGNTRRVIGILSLRSVLYRDNLDLSARAETQARSPLCLDQDLRLEAALSRFQRSGERLAIVTDAEGREWGLVSLQDILSTIFGEVHF